MRLMIPALLCVLLTACFPAARSTACTSFCFDSPDGPVFATNLDLITGEGHVFINRPGIAKEGYMASTTGETKKWVSRFGSVTFNLVGRELPWSGMNEEGLVMSSMQLTVSKCPEPDERPPLGESYLVQYVLDICADIDEVIEAVSEVRLPQYECANHYMVADKTGNCAVLEFLDGRFVHYRGETLPVKALANAPYVFGVAYIEDGTVPAFNPGASVERVAAANFRVENFDPEEGGSPVDYSFSILTETVVAPKKWWSDLFDEPYTRWNVVFDIIRREVYFRTVESPAVRKISLDSFDLSCEAPLLMIDVNIKSEGNVDRLFHTYDHDANLKIFRTFCKKWGIEITKEGAIDLVRFFESFECAD